MSEILRITTFTKILAPKSYFEYMNIGINVNYFITTTHNVFINCKDIYDSNSD